MNFFEIILLNIKIFCAFEVRLEVANILVTTDNALHRKLVYLQNNESSIAVFEQLLNYSVTEIWIQVFLFYLSQYLKLVTVITAEFIPYCFRILHCLKYRNFPWFSAVKMLWKRTALFNLVCFIQWRYTETSPLIYFRSIFVMLVDILHSTSAAHTKLLRRRK